MSGQAVNTGFRGVIEGKIRELESHSQANPPSQEIAQEQADSIPNTLADDLDEFMLRVQAKCQGLHILYKNRGDIVCKRIPIADGVTIRSKTMPEVD